MQQENLLNNRFPDEEPVNYRVLIEKYAHYWKWFVLGIVLALIIAFVKLRYTAVEYRAETTILIDQESNNNMAAFEELGLMNNSSSLVDNEIGILKSNSLMESVVKDLGLNVSYFGMGNVRSSELFNENSPIKITFFSKDSLINTLSATLTISIKSATKFDLIEGETISEHAFGEKIYSKTIGNYTITPRYISKEETPVEVIVKIEPVRSVAGYYRSKIGVDFLTKESEILQITMQDNVKSKTEIILNNLVHNYNKNTVQNKSLIAQNTNDFIKKRLEVIEADLSTADDGVQNFKKSNKLTDIPAEADIILSKNSVTEQKIVELNTQLKLAAFVTDYLSSNSEDLIPENLGLADVSISGNSEKYNELLLERNRILKSSSNLNPVIINLNTQINNLRKSVRQSLANLKSSLTISLNALKQQEAILNSKIIAVPTQEREFRDIQRQQQTIEALYLFLLQKREENAIALVAIMPNAKVIDTADGSSYPISTDRNKIYLIAFLLGFIVPFIGLYIKFMFDNKVHSVKDVEQAIKAPFLGDIPTTKLGNKVVVSGTERNSEAEAFRMLRSNINFMLAKVKEVSKTIYVTSTIPNEGKTFISINLASVLALSNKKVLLIGSDLRKPKISEYLNIQNKDGLSHFLMDNQLNASDVIQTLQEYNFDIVQSGIIPPNPSELLMNGRFEELIAYAKTKYDYIIIDTAPVSLVSDTLLLSVKADLFLYVIRANFLDKRMLEIPKKLYLENRLPNMAVVLNDNDIKQGYGYGYGAYEIKKPWWKRNKA